MGQMAADKASSPEVKEFGQRMVKDHSQANDQLKQIAMQKEGHNAAEFCRARRTR